MGALLLDIAEEIATHLARTSNAYNGRVCDGLPRFQRESASKPNSDYVVLGRGIGERMLHAQKKVSRHDRRSGNGAYDLGSRIREVEELNVGERHRTGAGSESKLLAQVGIVATKYQAPVRAKRGGLIDEVTTKLAPSKMSSGARHGKVSRQQREYGPTLEPHLGSRKRTAALKIENKRFVQWE
jgi:hypothetical protein